MPRFPLPSIRLTNDRLAPCLSIGLLAVTLGLAAPAAGAQGIEFKPGESQWGIGLGADAQRDRYREMGNETQGIPLIYYENHWVRVMGPSVELKLPSAGPVSFRVKARYALDGYEASDSPHLAGMAERESSVWVGGEAIWRTPFVNLSAELLTDASSHSEGHRFRLQADRRFTYGQFSFTPRIAAIQLDEEYVGYYYGVNASEARVGRPQYAGDAAVNMEVGLRIDYALTPKQNFFLDLRSTRLADEIQDSPLVDRSTRPGLRLGYLYRF